MEEQNNENDREQTIELIARCGIIAYPYLMLPKRLQNAARKVVKIQNMLLFFFFSSSVFVSLCVRNPQKLFFGFACSAGFGRPLLKKLL